MKKTLENMNELKQLIINNPELPIKFFIGEDGNCGDYSYEENDIGSVHIDYLVLYDGRYYDEEDLSERFYNDFYNDFENDEQLNEQIDTLMEKQKFEKFICVFIG